MVRTCHVDTCPVGIATQQPGAAREVRGDARAGHGLPHLRGRGSAAASLASLGLRSLDEAIGRVDLLRQPTTGEPRADSLDLAPLLGSAASGPTRFVGDAHIEPDRLRAGRPAGGGGSPGARRGPRSSSFATRSRTPTAPSARGSAAEIGAPLRRRSAARPRSRRASRASPARASARSSPRASSSGSTGEANDYVGKGMGGGRIVDPPARERRRRPGAAWGTRCSTAPPAASSTARAPRASASACATPARSPSSRAPATTPAST